MSGGSYRYLCYVESSELAGHILELEDMFRRLAGLGYANDAAMETAEVLRLVRSDVPIAAQRMIALIVEPMRKRLADVWQAVEWWDSGDWSESMVRRALEEYHRP